MSKLRVPSVQHLARNWHDSPEKIEEEFVRIALNPPFFNYNALNDAARDCLVYGVDEDQIIRGVIEKERRKRVQGILLEVIPLIAQHFSNVRPDYVNDVTQSYYSIGRDLKVPFRPPFMYGVGGQAYLPWFIFWKRNPMDDRRFSLFVTLAMEILRQDPDFEAAKFQILDFSEKVSGEGRRLSVIDAADVPILSSSETASMLAVFAEGFGRAEDRLRGTQPQSTKRDVDVTIDADQMLFWDR